MITIRPATLKDLSQITEIYNEAIQNTTATFDTESKTMEEQEEWFEKHDEQHPVIVAGIESKVVGWASLSKWSDRCAYDSTAEVSVYIHADYRGRGIGKQLLEIITIEGKKQGIHSILSRITEGNVASIHLHELFGYRHVGVMKEVGKKFGKLLDVNLMQVVFSAHE